MNIKIIIATHKKYWMPDISIYLPLHVGAEGKKDINGNELDIGYIKDNTGDNISKKNSNYCELTGLYWAWKNLKEDYIGLVHYRRHFCTKGIHSDKKRKVLTDAQLERLLKKNDVILPVPRHYYIETNYSQYVHAHHAEDLNMTRTIICERHPEYIKAFDDSMKSTNGHRFNMFIMNWDNFDAYCEWLFDILFELERRLDILNYSNYDARVFGFVGERLLDVWIKTKHIKYKNIPYVFLEKQNWINKGLSFIRRKIGIYHSNIF